MRTPLFRPRPMLLVAAAAGVAAFLAEKLQILAIFYLVAAIPFVLLAVLAARRRRRLFWLCAFAAITLLFAARAGTGPAVPALARTKLALTGRAAETAVQKPNRREVTLTDCTLAGAPVPGDILLRVYNAPLACARGQTVSVLATVYTPDPPRNAGAFDFQAYYRRRNILYTASASAEPSVSGAASHDLLAVAQGARARMIDTMDHLFPGNSAMMAGMILGDTDAMGEEELESFRRSGIAHLLSVSGLHVGFVVLLVTGLFRLIGGPRWLRFAGTALAILAYGFLTGFAPSVMRASLMALIVAAAPLLSRRPDTLSSFGLAFAVLLLIRPSQLFEASFQLSFAAVAGILLTQGWLQRVPLLRRLPRFLADGVAVSLGAQLGATGISVAWFGTVPLLATLVNIPAVPLSGALVMGGLPLTLLGMIVPAIAQPPAWLLNHLAGLLRLLADAASSLRWATLKVGAPTPEILVGTFLILIALSTTCLARTKPKLLFTLGCMLVMIAGLGIRAATVPRGLTLSMLDVGQGDGFYLRTEAGKRYLIDAGPTSAQTGQVAWRQSAALDAAFITHPHEDHFGGMIGALDWLNVRRIYLPRGYADMQADAGFEELMEKARRDGVEIVELSAGDRVVLDAGTYMDVLSCGSGGEGNANEDAMILRLVYAGQSALFMADAGAAAEGLPAVAVPSDILKVGHHGSKHSSAEGFLSRVRPKLALVSVGRGNRYGHPTPEALERLNAVGARVERTDRSGQVTLFCSPQGEIRMKRFLEAGS